MRNYSQDCEILFVKTKREREKEKGKTKFYFGSVWLYLLSGLSTLCCNLYYQQPIQLKISHKADCGAYVPPYCTFTSESASLFSISKKSATIPSVYNQ